MKPTGFHLPDKLHYSAQEPSAPVSLQWMNYKRGVLGLAALFLLELAAGGLLPGCKTRTAGPGDSVKHELSPGFYQTFTNRVDSPLPRPTGPFAVGRLERLLIDPSRNILYRTVTNGSLMATIWYPAGDVRGRAPGPYVSPREMTAWVELFRKYGARWDAAQIGRLTNSRSFSFPDAPFARQPRKFPLILYSHGQVGLRTDNSGSAEELASHGFVVVSSAHGGSAGMELPDGNLVKPQLEFHLSGNDTNPVAVAVFQDQTRDVQFLMDELARLNATDRFFAGRLDTNHIGVFGFSYGGASAAELCNVDHRCSAGVALDPGGHPDLSQLHFKQPFMVLTGPHGLSSGSRLLFEQLAGDACFIQFHNASHAEFSDAAEFFQPSADARVQTLVRKYLVSFFTRYLKNADGHELDASAPEAPQIELFLRK